MENENSKEFTLPPAPRGLCFDRNDFVKKNFSVDNFLDEHQNVASLESMRDDLGVYLKILRLAMIELINKDYANFVNLSATLIGFDKAICKVKVPLEKINEEFLNVKQCLEDAMKELSMWLHQRHTLQKKKELLRYYSQTIKGITTLDHILKSISDKTKHEQIMLADRAITQYNQLKFAISKCDNLLKADQKTQFSNIGEKLVLTINDLLFKFLNDNDEDNLLKVLLALAALDRVSETEKILRKQSVAPLLQDIISERSLQTDTDGLQGVYQRVLSLLETQLKLLTSVTQHSRLTFIAKKYNFLVNCFWCEVESRLEVNLTSIFAPGNPTVFYERYTASMQFLRRIEEYCSDDQTVKQLHKTDEYKSFHKRWNLPVYFQIRFQEIAGSLESALDSKPSSSIDKSEYWRLRNSAVCWSSISRCGARGVWLRALSPRFLRLALQLVSRYATWAANYCTQNSPPKGDLPEADMTFLDNCINIYLDANAMLQRLPELSKVVCGELENSEEIVQRSCLGAEKRLRSVINDVKTGCVQELSSCCEVRLRAIRDVPRAYRKTNRPTPTEPSPYIPATSQIIGQFHIHAASRLPSEYLAELMQLLFDGLTDSYYSYVEEVVTSVQRTEESLRRLKASRDGGATSGPSSTSDGDKIRAQLALDVRAYTSLAHSLHVDSNRLRSYSKLEEVVARSLHDVHNK